MSRKTILHALVCAFCLLPVQAVSSQVFINEFHYDNSGSDVNEGVELAGTAGAVLDGWQLVFYNGSNGNSYNTLSLNGIFDDEVNGFGFLSFELTGIQNGAPDGMALVTPDYLVSEFISYEGLVDAVAGPATGMSSQDIGLYESSGTPIGNSLYLAGFGSRGSDFYWVSGDATFGTLNEGQRFEVSFKEASAVPAPGVFGLIALPLLLLGRMNQVKTCLRNRPV